ncbi:hypothetical protein [Criblamydia sequanensis]|uniref:Membrane protein n=1 Tax=Candidatus Criblamydia sequanensis CRIB-18 TaxID=1437425 RepID=A0A090CZA0_9BACT|nr:hypothetical protein [Criblamydia sequanensis]CDR34287.1 putative membrane protein [Criblamydia sequanensis CRIB-18]
MKAAGSTESFTTQSLPEIEIGSNNHSSNSERQSLIVNMSGRAVTREPPKRALSRVIELTIGSILVASVIGGGTSLFLLAKAVKKLQNSSEDRPDSGEIVLAFILLTVTFITVLGMTAAGVCAVRKIASRELPEEASSV